MEHHTQHLDMKYSRVCITYFNIMNKDIKYWNIAMIIIMPYFEDFWGGKQLFSHGKDTLTPIASQTRLLERVL